MIFSTYEKTCKENLGKSFSEVLLAVPQLNLQKKQSRNERKKQRLEKQREFKTYVEAVWKDSDVDSHLAQRASLASRGKQRIYQSFETIQQAKTRLEKTPPAMKERSHIPKEVIGNTEQLRKDVGTGLMNLSVGLQRQKSIKSEDIPVIPPHLMEGK